MSEFKSEILSFIDVNPLDKPKLPPISGPSANTSDPNAIIISPRKLPKLESRDILPAIKSLKGNP